MEITRTANGLFRPAYPSDYTLFQHCSGGLESVSAEFFKDVVAPLLEIHGVSDIFLPIVMRDRS